MTEPALERVARAIHDERHGAHITSALADSLWEDPEVREQAYALARAAFRAMDAGVRGSAEERSDDPSKAPVEFGTMEIIDEGRVS